MHLHMHTHSDEWMHIYWEFWWNKIVKCFVIISEKGDFSLHSSRVPPICISILLIIYNCVPQAHEERNGKHCSQNFAKTCILRVLVRARAYVSTIMWK